MPFLDGTVFVRAEECQAVLGPFRTCPLWVKSRHMQCKKACPL